MIMVTSFFIEIPYLEGKTSNDLILSNIVYRQTSNPGKNEIRKVGSLLDARGTTPTPSLDPPILIR